MLSFHSAAIPSATNPPTLQLRKDIWSKFPVCLVKLSSEDGIDRYAVKWHQIRLRAWSQGIPAYKEITQNRLLEALRAATNRWRVLPSKDFSDLCILEMIVPEEPKCHTSIPAIPDVPPVLRNMGDLGTVYPVCWKAVGGDRFAVEFYNTKVRHLADVMNCSEQELRTTILLKMFDALQMNGWGVLPPPKLNSACLCIVSPSLSGLLPPMAGLPPMTGL